MRMTQLNVERVKFLSDSGGGFQFSDPPAECLKLVPVSLLNIGGSLRQLGIKSCPCALVVVSVLLAEQPECLFSAECCHTSKIFYAEAVENFSPLQVAYAQTQRTFDFAGYRCSVDCWIAFGLPR